MAAGGLSIEHADLSNQRSRTKVLLNHPELLRIEVVSDLAATVPRLVRSDRRKALGVAELAMMIAGRIGDAGVVAYGLRAKGNALHGLGRNKAAVEHHRRALELFRTVGNLEQIARTLSTAIQPLILQGHLDQALASAREAREIFSRQGDRWRLARLELNLGNIFDRQDRFEEALACYESAYRYLSVHGADDPEAIVAAVHNIAVSCIRLNDFRKAAAAYEQARRFAVEHEMHVVIAQADYNIAWLYYLRGDYSRAISMLRAAREACRSSGDQYHLGLCSLDLSEIYLELNLSQEAEETARQASATFQRMGMRYERGKALANVAIALGQQGKTAHSLALFLQARRILVRERNKVIPSLIDLYRAVVLIDEEREAEAQRLCLAALKSFQRFKLANKAVVCRLLLARIHLRGNDLKRARMQCARAVKSVAALESPVLSCQAQALMGQIEGVLGRDQRSYQAYQRARESLEQLRNSIHGEELKISFMKDRVEIYEALVALCLKRGHTGAALIEAFDYIEQAKSRSLLDVLSTSRSASWLAPQGQTEFATKIRDLREELNWYFHKIEMAQFDPASQQAVADLRKQSRQRERELLELLREHSPEDGNGASQQAAVALTVERIRQKLPADALILEYFQVQGRIVVLLLSHSQMKFVSLADSSEVSTLMELLQFQLAKPHLGAEYVRTFGDNLLRSIRVHLENLYKALIAPIREWLGAAHLIIAPHGILHTLPFQALFDGARYLIEEFTLSYAPSASVYAVCQARSTSTGNRSLILGIPDESVPLVVDEVQAVAGSLPNSELFLGAKATAECLRDRGQHSRFIHIATHGYFRQDSPMFSGIRLGDSYLSLYDLYQLRLPAELVALSGCSTGLNVVAAGDELLGLARGIIHAGTQTSLLTLWDVHDRGTAQLMKHFYEQLASADNKAQALQKAMLLLKSDYPHPYYWAPLVLIGKV
jgi:CHAT domain-containing protein/tetratricopeptide (TPR) repeat protein